MVDGLANGKPLISGGDKDDVAAEGEAGVDLREGFIGSMAVKHGKDEHTYSY